MRGSAQRNVLLTLAHTPAHRLGGNPHTTWACRHPQSCVCDLVWVQSLKERASFWKFAFSRFLTPWRGQGALSLLPLSSWPCHPTPLLVGFKPWFMLTPAKGGRSVRAWVTVPTAPPGCCVQNLLLSLKLRCQGRPQVLSPCRRFWIHGWHRDRRVDQGCGGALREQQEGIAGVRRMQ